jgi:hypothetical protein
VGDKGDGKMTQEELGSSLGYSRSQVAKNEKQQRLDDSMHRAVLSVYATEYHRFLGDLPRSMEPATRVTLDFWDVPHWARLFTRPREVDLFFSGGGKWRREHAQNLDHLMTLSPKPRVRAVLPDLLDDVGVVQLGQRMGLTRPYVKRAIAEAYFDFLGRGIDVWVTNVPPRYAMYRFDNEMVVSLYNQQRKHTPEVPTLLVPENAEFRWFMKDFESLLAIGPPSVRKLDPELGRDIALRTLTNKRVTRGKWTPPPRGKYFKALGVIADGRIYKVTGRGAFVESSTGKHYIVEYDERRNAIDSNDGGSYFWGYMNYPMIAYLIVTGRLPHPKGMVKWFKGIDFESLSTRFDRDYGEIQRQILGPRQNDEVNVARLEKFIRQTEEQIEAAGLKRLNTQNLPRAEWAEEYQRREEQRKLFLP